MSKERQRINRKAARNRQTVSRTSATESRDTDAVRQLQRHAIQRRVVVGQRGDKYEREAEAVASRVMRAENGADNESVQHMSEKQAPDVQSLGDESAPDVQSAISQEERANEEGERVSKMAGEDEVQQVQRVAESEPAASEEEAQALQRTSDSESSGEDVQRESEGEETVQADADEGTEAVQMSRKNRRYSGLEERARKALDERGAGEPLDRDVQAKLESRIGHDFSSVRIHRRPSDQQAAKSINARAFTNRNHIWLGPGESTRNLRLLAHEATHVAQQGAAAPLNAPRTSSAATAAASGVSRVQRDEAGPAAPEPTTPQPAGGDTAPGRVELKRRTAFELDAEQADWLENQDGKKGKVKVAFGSAAKGTINVRVKKQGYVFNRQAVPLTHALFTRIGEALPGVQPSLIISSSGSAVTGYVGLQHGGVPKNYKDFGRTIAKAPEMLGLPGFKLPKTPAVINKLENGELSIGLTDVSVSFGRVLKGSISVQADDVKITTFAGKVNTSIKGLAEGSFDLKRGKTGGFIGSGKVSVNLPKEITGSVFVAWDGESVSGEGQVGYSGEKLSGNVTLKVMERAKADELEAQNKAPDAEEGKKPTKKKRRGRPDDYVVFGDGDLEFSFTDWLTGTAHVIVDSRGYLTIIGKITPQKEFELFPQKDYNKHLFKVEARARYGIPVVGNIFIFANIGMDAFAKLGPGKFYKIEVDGTYSTDPKKKQSFSIRGTLNISAAAGLKLRGEAGAGLEVLAHDIKAGAGLNALAGVRGYTEATPIIGYREKAKEGEDKKGEFFLRGEFEIAAQPFLGLGGDLFVEIDAPWWSPVPDKKWTWPLGSKEYPLGGTLGIGANVDYVFGSGEAPKVEFGKVDFDSSKFMTDLYSNKSKSKSGKKKDPKKGDWKEKNQKSAEPPKPPKGGAPQGKLKDTPAAKSKVQPGGPKRKVKPADPNARTADGRTVKDYQKDAAAKGKKQAKGDGAGGSDKKSVDAAKRLVRSALNTRLPNGASSVADIKGVLRDVQPKVKSSLSSLSVTDAGAKGPKKEGAIGFKVSGKAGSSNVSIAAVKYSEKGKAVDDNERWAEGVKAITRVMKKMEKRNVSFNDVRAQLTGWASQFGFKSLKLKDEQEPPVIVGSMSPEKPVYEPSLDNKGVKKSDPIPLKWPKVNYKNIEIRQEKDDQSPPVTAKPEGKTTLYPKRGKERDLGVKSDYLKPTGVYQNREERGRTKQQTFRNWLADRGYADYGNPDPYEADHLIDYTFGGPDKWDNLWPLADDKHKEKTSKVWYKQKVTEGAFKDWTVSQIRDRPGKVNKKRWFSVS